MSEILKTFAILPRLLHALVACANNNIYAVDLSKAFDKMNHDGLFIKLMERNIPMNLLMLLNTGLPLE